MIYQALSLGLDALDDLTHYEGLGPPLEAHILDIVSLHGSVPDAPLASNGECRRQVV